MKLAVVLGSQKFIDDLEVHFVHGSGAYDSALVMTDVLKLLSKPQAFSGEEKDWKNWRFSFMAYVGAVDKAMATETMTAMKKTDPVAMKDLSGDEQQRSATMFSLLVQLWKKRALMLLQTGEDNNGYEAMRRYEARANKMKPGLSLSGLQQILNFEFADVKADPQKMMEKLEEFEHMVDQYETVSTLGLDDEVKMAVIMRGIPEELKAAVYSNPGSFDTYDKVKDTLVNLIIGRKLYTGVASANDPAPMEVDALWKGKGGGKSKGKGNGKSFGKGKDGKSKFEGACNGCGKTGHKLVDCWFNKSGEKAKGEKGKGKGKTDSKGKGQEVECYKCGKKGHYAKDCWSKPKQVAEIGKDEKEEIGAIEYQDDYDCMMALDAHETPKMLIDNDHWADSDSDLDEYYEIAAMTVEKKTAEILIDSGGSHGVSEDVRR